MQIATPDYLRSLDPDDELTESIADQMAAVLMHAPDHHPLVAMRVLLLLLLREIIECMPDEMRAAQCAALIDFMDSLA